MRGYGGIIFEEDIYSGNEDLSAPLFINCCGYLKADGVNVSLSRTRKDYYLIYLVNGTGHYRLNSEVAADAGSIIIYKPGEMQDYYYLGNENAEIYWIHFTGFLACGLLSQLALTERNIYRTGIDSGCISLFESIIREIQIKKPNYHQYCVGCLLQLLSVLSRKAAFLRNGEGVFKNSNIENVIRLMHLEYATEHRIEYYAGICGLSVNRFIYNFKTATQLTPARYMEKLRIDKARELLVNTGLTIDEISSMVGYNDAFYFSKAFKRVTGLAPSSFRSSGVKIIS